MATDTVESGLSPNVKMVVSEYEFVNTGTVSILHRTKIGSIVSLPLVVLFILLRALFLHQIIVLGYV